MIKDIIALIKQQEKDRRALIAIGLILFLIFPFYSATLIVDEVSLATSSTTTQARILSVRSSALFFMSARVRYEIDQYIGVHSVYYFPILERYNAGETVAVKYCKWNKHCISFVSPLWKRLVYPCFLFILSLLTIAVINIPLQKKLFSIKMDGKL